MTLSVNFSIQLRALKSDSNEGMPKEFDTPSEANIMAKFPREMLTPEVRMNIANVIKHMEALHNEAAEAMKCMEKLVPTITIGAFCLILQAMVQPCIMIQCWFRKYPLPWEQCHLVNATFQMVKIPDRVKLSIGKQLNFQMDHQGLGCKFLI